MKQLTFDRTWSKFKPIKILAIVGYAIVVIYICGCNKTEKGKLVGINVSFSLDDAVKGDIKNMYYQGTLVVKLDNGKEVNALCKKEMVDSLRGGQILEIEYDNTLKNWVVKKILKQFSGSDYMPIH